LILLCFWRDDKKEIKGRRREKIMATLCCSSCDAPNATLVCGVCDEFAFCSMKCSDDLAEGHYQVCYDKDSHVQPILEALGLQIGDANTIDDYLLHSELPPSALDMIGGLFRRSKGKRSKRSKKNKRRKGSSKKHRAAHKKQAAVSRKKKKKLQAILNNPAATTAAKEKAQRSLLEHEAKATYHEQRAASYSATSADI